MASDLAIVIVNWNTRDLLRDCLTSLGGEQSLSRHIIVVDNGSTDESAQMVRERFPQARLIANAENTGFTRANNQGLAAWQGRYVLLLNSDTRVPPGALASLAQFMDQHSEVGVVGPRQVRADGSPLPYTFGHDPTLRYLLTRGLNRLLFRRSLHDWATETVQEVDWISGACLLARREAIDQVGLLDENIFMYFEDVDWCLRFRQAGWKVYYNPQVKIIHLGGQSLIKNPAARPVYYRSLEYFYAKHYGALAQFLLRTSLAPYRLWVRH